jgi:hypothetical protein
MARTSGFARETMASRPSSGQGIAHMAEGCPSRLLLVSDRSRPSTRGRSRHSRSSQGQRVLKGLIELLKGERNRYALDSIKTYS